MRAIYAWWVRRTGWWWNLLCRVEMHDWDWANAHVDADGTFHLKCHNYANCGAHRRVRKERAGIPVCPSGQLS